MKKLEGVYTTVYGRLPTPGERKHIQAMATALNTSTDDELLTLISLYNSDHRRFEMIAEDMETASVRFSQTSKDWQRATGEALKETRSKAQAIVEAQHGALKAYSDKQKNVLREIRWMRQGLVASVVLFGGAVTVMAWQQRALERSITNQASAEVRVAEYIENREAQRGEDRRKRGQANAETLEAQVFSSLSATIVKRVSESMTAVEAQKPLVSELLKAEDLAPGTLKFAASPSVGRLIAIDRAEPRMIEFASSNEGLAMYRLFSVNKFSSCPMKYVNNSVKYCAFQVK